MVDENRALMDNLIDRLAALRPNTGRPVREFSLELYRQLARGEPVRPEALAEALNRPSWEMRQTIGTWPSLIQMDDDKRVVGFGGLSLRPTRHRFTVESHTMYTWCAWDALFIPEIIDQEARVESICPQTGQAISLTVLPSRIAEHEPEQPVLSFLLPDAPELRDDVRGSFCELVRFFASRQAGESWIQRTNDLFLITLDEAFDLGKRKNAVQFGDSLAVSTQLDRMNQLGRNLRSTG